MSSNNTLATLLERIDALDRSLAALPLSTMTPRQLEELIRELDHVIGQADDARQRLIGRLIATGDPVRMGGSSWAEVLSRRLRISPAEARRLVARAAPAA